MHGVNTLIDRLIAREGGYCNHPADRGGPTNMGITLKTLATHRRAVVTDLDVRRLTREEAAEIYLRNYYLVPKIDSLPDGVQEQTFDIGVMSGPQRAIRMLQEACVILGSEIKVDGLVGPQTRRAAGSHPSAYINNMLVYLRCAFYDDIVKSRPSQKAFIRGWHNRARHFRKIIG
jgi:lysozyme family protein